LRSKGGIIWEKKHLENATVLRRNKTDGRKTQNLGTPFAQEWVKGKVCEKKKGKRKGVSLEG